MQKKPSSLTGKIDLGIGVASHPELVEEGVDSLYVADAYRKAVMPAQHSKILHRPISDYLTKKLSLNSLPWLDIRTREGGKAIELRQVGEVCAIGPSSSALADCSLQWGGAYPSWIEFVRMCKKGLRNGLRLNPGPQSLRVL